MSAGKNGEIIKKSIGMTTSITSFYDSYANNGSGAWAVGSIIDPKDNSGKVFLNNLVKDDPEIGYYMDNAKKGQKYDFKATNGTLNTLYQKMKTFIEVCLSAVRKTDKQYIPLQKISVILQRVMWPEYMLSLGLWCEKNSIICNLFKIIDLLSNCHLLKMRNISDTNSE